MVAPHLRGSDMFQSGGAPCSDRIVCAKRTPVKHLRHVRAAFSGIVPCESNSGSAESMGIIRVTTRDQLGLRTLLLANDDPVGSRRLVSDVPLPSADFLVPCNSIHPRGPCRSDLLVTN